MMSQALRVPAVRNLPITFGRLVKHRIDDELWQSFLAPAASSRAVRRDLGKFLRGISTRYTRRTAELLPEFARPTLFAWAQTARPLPIAHARKLAAGMPDAEVRSIPDSYAFVPLDQPARLVSAIDEFVSSRLAA